MPTLNDAIELATQKHAGQLDKAGQPYISHPKRVMENLGAEASEDLKIVAILHDVVEDCGVSFDDLRALGYCETIIEALRGVTKLSEDEDYEKFVERLAPNDLARAVKLADLKDNMNRSRLGEITAKDEARMAKYQKARDYLENWDAKSRLSSSSN